jgi:multidrug efflux pump
MSLADVSIRRPVLAIVMSLLLVLLGAVGFHFLGVREYPAVDPPIVTVTTNYPGASPEVVAAQITEPLEQSISGVPGIRVMSSTSRSGQSQIRIEFDLSVSMEEAANDVRDKVSAGRARLPIDVDPTQVEKADADSTPIIFLTLRSETKTILEIAALADTLFKERLQTIAGVANVRIMGDRRYAMRLLLDADRLAANALTPEDVRSALERENVDLPAGRLESQSTETGIRALARLVTADDFNRLTLKNAQGHIIQLSDVGRAELSAENVRTGLRDLGVPMVGLAVVPQPNTNAIEIADEVYRRLEQIQRVLPPEYTAEVGYDFTTYVRRSVTEVEETLAIAFGLVTLIIYAFLRDWRATLVPVVAIPISIIAGFFVLYVAGFSINILTLVGLVLAIGLVCDDAIVVLENTYTKIERGASPLTAAREGAREVFFAVVSTTVTLCAVFLPILFLQGLSGRLFREFAAVVAGSVLVSAFVALSLSPMMCRFVLKARPKRNWLQRTTEPFFTALSTGYDHSLTAFLKVRWLTLPILLGVGAYTAWAFGTLPRELAPIEDRSNIRLNVRAPEAASFNYTQESLDEIALWVRDNVPELSRTFSITAAFGGAVNTGLQNIYFVPPEQRERSQQQIFQQISAGLANSPRLRVLATQPPTIGERGGQPLQYVLQAPSLEDLRTVLPQFMDRAQKRPELRFLDVDFNVNREETTVSLNRERAAALGVSALDVARTLQLAFGDARFGYFVMNGRQYQVIGQLDRPFRDEPNDLKRLFARANDGRLVSLDNLITTESRTAPSALYRFDRYVSATISGGLAAGYSLGDGISALDQVAADVLPPTFNHSLAGQARELMDGSSSLGFAFGLALLIVYLVLAAQFESFIDPWIILFSVPLALSGALLSLQLTASTLNVFSQIGIIMLVGLVTKNGILIVEFANQRRDAGATRAEAIREAAVERLRPILMTSLATILGILPVALSLGASAGSRQSLGIVVVGGLVAATALTLYIVPALFLFLSPGKRAARGATEDGESKRLSSPPYSDARPIAARSAVPPSVQAPLLGAAGGSNLRNDV